MGMIDEKRIAELRAKIAASAPLVGNEPWPDFIDALNTLDALWQVTRAAERLIYPPRTEYAAGSKKAALRDALAALKEAT